MHKPLEGDLDVNVGAVIGNSPDMAQFHLWRAQWQRDHGQISDREMDMIEALTGLMAPRARLLWNPFTNEFRTEKISQHYRSGAYLDDYGSTARIIAAG